MHFSKFKSNFIDIIIKIRTMTLGTVHIGSKFTNVTWVSEEKDMYGPEVGFVNVRNLPDF